MWDVELWENTGRWTSQKEKPVLPVPFLNCFRKLNVSTFYIEYLTMSILIGSNSYIPVASVGKVTLEM